MSLPWKSRLNCPITATLASVSPLVTDLLIVRMHHWVQSKTISGPSKRRERFMWKLSQASLGGLEEEARGGRQPSPPTPPASASKERGANPSPRPGSSSRRGGNGPVSAKPRGCRLSKAGIFYTSFCGWAHPQTGAPSPLNSKFT